MKRVLTVVCLLPACTSFQDVTLGSLPPAKAGDAATAQPSDREANPDAQQHADDQNDVDPLDGGDDGQGGDDTEVEMH